MKLKSRDELTPCIADGALPLGSSMKFSVPGILALLLTIGCASTKPPRPAVTGDPVVDGKNAIVYGPAMDRVLWEYRVGLAALRRGDYEEARRQLDEAITRIGGVY